VLEVDRRHATVMLPGGEFRRIRLNSTDVRVGQQIELPAAQPRFALPLTARVRATSIVALVLIAVLLPVGYFQICAPAKVMAYVSIDLNPSLRFGVDMQGRVATSEALGREGELVLAEIDWSRRPLEQVVCDVVRLSAEKGFVSPDSSVTVVMTVIPEDASVPASLSQKIQEAAVEINNSLSALSVPASVRLIEGDKQLAQKALELGLTPGEAAVLILAREAGLDVSAEQIKNEKARAAIARAGGDLERVLDGADARPSWDELIEKHSNKPDTPDVGRPHPRDAEQDAVKENDQHKDEEKHKDQSQDKDKDKDRNKGKDFPEEERHTSEPEKNGRETGAKPEVPPGKPFDGMPPGQKSDHPDDAIRPPVGDEGQDVQPPKPPTAGPAEPWASIPPDTVQPEPEPGGNGSPGHGPPADKTPVPPDRSNSRLNR